MLYELKRVRKEAGKTQQQVAVELGVPISTYRNWEYGVNIPRQSECIRISDYFGVTIDELIGRSKPKGYQHGSTTPFVNVPRYGSIAAGEPLEMISSDDSHPIPNEMAQKHPRAFLLTVKGSSMDKVVPNGAYALIDPDAEVFDGDAVAVNINGFDATLKRYYKLANGVALKPDSNDPTHKEYLIDYSSPNAENVRVLGKLVWYTIPFDFKF